MIISLPTSGRGGRWEKGDDGGDWEEAGPRRNRDWDDVRERTEAFETKKQQQKNLDRGPEKPTREPKDLWDDPRDSKDSPFLPEPKDMKKEREREREREKDTLEGNWRDRKKGSVR
jgi:hypothetical protein